ncbi:hypothetical protein B9T33_13520 [Acinetobacter sp. ANC 5054]|uniref:hypothetical protein n=1 Tax=Acinetobacter sp. ANC 5054 TaxID=1977877 RepID=UPI000A35A544|nr:hypothetical protein [Acinetobacter sp. ANC 5054]OTG78979.1 hypothetical protein B9T33_13520 [Acinetobacter sp. ANC 5054]
MLNIAFISLIVLLVIIIMILLQRKSKTDQHFRSLQENLDHTRVKLAETEAQHDDLNFEISQLRIQNSGLKIQVDKVKKYQDIVDIENYVEHRTLQANGLLEVTKINADIMLQDIKSHIEQVRQFLQQVQKKAQQQAEAGTRAHLKSVYNQVMDQQELEQISQALQHKIQSNKDQFFLPVPNLISQLIDGFDEHAAAQNLLAVRCKIIDAMEQQASAACNYVDEDRRLASIQLFSLVFNSRADLYLAQLNLNNLGELIQALKDDFSLLNMHGIHFSQSQLFESYRDLRVEELKMAAILLQLKQTENAIRESV